jgi:hypothetical protein
MRHVQTRLRRGGVVGAVVLTAVGGLVVLVVGSLIGHVNRADPVESMRVLCYIFMGGAGLLLVGGAVSRVTAAVYGDRASGMLESLRMTPAPPAVHAAGYALGAPLREALMSAVLLPFVIYTMARGGVPFVHACQYGLAIVAGAALFTLAGMVSALSAAPAGQRPADARGAVGGLVFIALFGMNLIGVLMSRASRGRNSESLAGIEVLFFGFPLPLPILAAAVETFFIVFLALAAARKMGREGAPGLTKRQALLFFALLHLLALGVFWEALVWHGSYPSLRYSDDLVGYAVALYVADGLLGVWLVFMMIPTRAAYLRELRRTRGRPTDGGKPGIVEVLRGAEGETHLPWGAALCGVNALAYGGLLALAVYGGVFSLAVPDTFLPYCLPPLLYAAVLLGHGAAQEFFSLRLRKRAGATSLAGILFAVVWILPLVLGVAVGLAGGGEAAPFVASPSPLAGFAAAFTAIDGNHRSPLGGSPLAVAGCCLAVQGVLSFVFVQLLRREHRVLEAAAAGVQ